MKKFSFLLIFLILSCKDKTSTKNMNYAFSLEKTSKKIQFALDKDEKYISYERIQVIQDSLVSYLNRDFFISFFNIESGKREAKIYFKEDGPNGLKDAFRKYFVKNMDSVFFIDKHSNDLFITNLQGKVKFKKRLVLNDEFNIALSFNSPIFGYDNNIILPLFSYFNKEKGNFIKNENYPVAIVYNYKLDKFYNSPLSFSKATLENKNPMLQMPISSLDVKRNRLVYLFRQQNIIYTVNGDKIKSYEFPFNFTNYFDNLDFGKSINHFVESSNNFNIYYDKYRDVFYLLISRGIPFINKNGIKMNFNNKPFSCLVFDKNFNVLSEKYFEGGKYEFRNCFVGKKGFYISENNQENPAMDENYLTFSLFKLIKSEK